jgi:phosphatidylethanolamine-binding protein (PEBP) family uncharacterized protein
MEGGMIDPMYTCAGGQHFPAISWTAGPAGTMSYAVVFFDTSIMLVHITMLNILAATHALPPLPMGAGVMSIGTTNGTTWAGPCPNGAEHIYDLTVYALKTPMYMGPAANRTAIRTALENTGNADVLARARVTGRSNARQQ